MSRKTLSKVLNGKEAITPEMALRLELVFGKPSAAHWLRLQKLAALESSAVKSISREEIEKDIN
ncbi:helix-turn-helix transcriptional regulator [Alteromonas sp. ALT199]|uniref:helix-turn-helix transcriptional regulator n=1 Tax=unclassified Alteromonas TaxID=2614992 RepID=UPI0028832955|nr:hypothetical protein [Alteromonas sp. ALT199]